MKRIDSRELTEFGIQFLCAYGASPNNAAVITGHLVDNDLKGVESQGAMRLFEYARFMAEGQVDGQASPAVHEAAPNVFRVDGSRGFGIVAMEMAVEKMLQALSGGRATAVAAVTGVGHTGRVGAYSEALAKHFCFGCVYGGAPPPWPSPCPAWMGCPSPPILPPPPLAAESCGWPSGRGLCCRRDRYWTGTGIPRSARRTTSTEG